MTHGVSGYALRCRCLICVNGKREADRLYRQANKATLVERARRYYIANRDHHAEHCRLYYLENKQRVIAASKRSAKNRTEQRRIYMREYAIRNSDLIKLYKSAWHQANKPKVRLQCSAYRKLAGPAAKRRLEVIKRRALKRNAPGSTTSTQFIARWEYYGGKCWMCGRVANSTDHVIPLSKGGSNWPANLRPACLSCNSGKRDKVHMLPTRVDRFDTLEMAATHLQTLKAVVVPDNN